MNPNEIISEEGNIKFKAKYTPSDTQNYEIRSLICCNFKSY